MNKFKKLAIASVSLVMAGTMALSFAACGKKDDGGKVSNTSQADEYGVLNKDGTLNYDAYKRDTAVTLNLAVGHNSAATSTAYQTNLGEQIVMPDGVQYEAGSMKPAWAAMGKDLNINWVDNYKGKSTSANLGDMLSNNYYANVDLFTSDLSKVIDQVSKGTDILNLGDYLDYMPNFSAFLKSNPVVYLSLLQYGMDTKTGEGKTLYVAPYFDGNDDIERYCLMRKDWVEKLLNGDTASGATATLGETKVQPFFTEGYEIESLTADGAGKQTIKKDLVAAKTAVADANSDLGKAFAAITGNNTYDGNGNIVDIMNKAGANATGAQLLNLYRAYIDVAYKVGNNAAFAKDKRANLFVGYDAAWDVDDLVALLRIIKTNASYLSYNGTEIGGLVPRQGNNDRTPDLVSLAAQLYGARGATSRYEYTYIDANGDLQDARNDDVFYQALANMNLLKQEGLIVDYSSTDFKGDCGVQGNKEYFMMYDYSQTQTLDGFYVEDTSLSGNPVKNPSYYFTPVMTPVSKWDTNSNGTAGEKGEIIRFTESWRSTKTGGLCVNGAVKNDTNKLKAALQFIDYLYSEDGQIVSTFGPMAKNADGEGGFWYNTEATSEQVKNGQYFTFKGVKYSGSEYKGRYTPTVTDKLYKSFKGLEVNGYTYVNNDKISNSKLSFTNYARQLIGSTLPVGVKDQSFENQLTSKMGQAGAGIVGTALDKGTVKGMTLTIDKNNYWFTVVPTGLPIRTTVQTETLGNSDMLDLRYMSGEKKTDSKAFFSVFNWVILNGTDVTATPYNQQDVNATWSSLAELKTLMSETKKAQAREEAMAPGWTTAKEYWEFLKP